MTHQEVLRALSGMLMAMYVAMVSSTIVTNALPVIVADLHGSQTGYTWVVVATLLTMTASTPVWGKLADLFSQKLLVQISLVIFSVGSLLAGFASSMGLLIAARAVQGIGVGGLMSLVFIVIASMVAPRERARYSGYLGAVFGLATVSGPLLGGLIVDTIGWRWCFWVGLPVAVAAFALLQRTLHLPPTVKRKAHIDYLGALLIVAGVSLLLVWTSLAGNQFAWGSTKSLVLVSAAIVVTAIAVWVEAKVAKDPMIPLRLFRDRTTTLATIASIMVGVGMYGTTVYMSQYFQMSQAMSPTKAGLMSTPMVIAMMASTMVTGKWITGSGRWKNILVGGMVLTIAGFGLLSTIDGDTPLWRTGLYMAVLGVGIGAAMQNLVLAVQNNTSHEDMGAASAVVTFFRSIGGSAGVAALGAVLSHRVAAGVQEGLAKLHIPVPAEGSSRLPKVSDLPEPIRSVFEHAFGAATGDIFLVAAPFAVLALVAVLFIREEPLRTSMFADENLSPEVAAEVGLEQPGGYR